MGDSLRVATYNVHSCVGGDRQYDPRRILRILQEINADVLALQEVGGYLMEGEGQLKFFERELGMRAVSGPNLVRQEVQFGNAVLVKGRIRDAHLINLSVLAFEPRGAIDCVLETRIGDLRVIATHLGLFRRERRRQIEWIADMLSEKHIPLTVILGDFNIFGRERAVLKRVGSPFPPPKLPSFPARRPLMSLDRLWTIPNERLIGSKVHRTPLSRLASDHLPVVGEISAEAAPGIEPA